MLGKLFMFCLVLWIFSLIGSILPSFVIGLLALFLVYIALK